jgi:ethyl tert-butyl ether degradation ethD
LSDYAGNSVADFDKLIALFSEDITMLSADGSQMKGKTAVISFFKQFFERNKTTKHFWKTIKVAENTLETHWAVSGKQKDGTFFAFKGKDTVKLNSEGKINYLKVEFLR